MENANYLAGILDIDYNRCYKFAMKYRGVSKEELLEAYFCNPSGI
jgi:hypothetical protein